MRPGREKCNVCPDGIVVIGEYFAVCGTCGSCERTVVYEKTGKLHSCEVCNPNNYKGRL